MRVIPLFLSAILFLSCAQSPDYMSKDAAAIKSYKSFVKFHNHVKVIYIKEDKTITETLRIKYRGEDGFGKSREEYIPWSSVKYIELINKKSFGESAADAASLSIFL